MINNQDKIWEAVCDRLKKDVANNPNVILCHKSDMGITSTYALYTPHGEVVVAKADWFYADPDAIKYGFKIPHDIVGKRRDSIYVKHDIDNKVVIANALYRLMSRWLNSIDKPLEPTLYYLFLGNIRIWNIDIDYDMYGSARQEVKITIEYNFPYVFRAFKL